MVSPTLVSNKELTLRLKTHLTNGCGVTRVTTNHYCGSVTIYYDPKIAGEKYFLDMLNHVTWEKRVQSDNQFPMSEEENASKDQLSEGQKKKGIWNLWNLAGSFFVGAGILGIFLPLLPTVPLLLLAAFCYWRGSPKFYNWLINLGSVGQLIKDFREGKGLPAKVKFRSILFLWISIGISTIFLLSNIALKIILLLVAIGVTIYILRTKTSDGSIETLSR